VNETVDLRTPDEIARLRHFLLTALNNIIGFAEVVRRQAEEQGARSAASLMKQIAAAGREGVEVVQRVLPAKSHVSESALPMLRSNLGTRLKGIETGLTSFRAKSKGACAAEVGKMRLALEDLMHFERGTVRNEVHPAPAQQPVRDGMPQPVRDLSLTGIVQGVGDLLQSALPESARLRMSLTPGLPAIAVDPLQIQQLVFVLVSNAVEAIGAEQGTVTIESGLRYLPQGSAAEPPFQQLAPGYYVYVSVSDTGSGIDDSIRPRIFEPFFSTKSRGRGTGLSGAVAIARAHDGVIHVESAPRQGSRFEALFPAPPPETAQSR
jgi:signal transduction histidine kinase